MTLNDKTRCLLQDSHKTRMYCTLREGYIDFVTVKAGGTYG